MWQSFRGKSFCENHAPHNVIYVGIYFINNLINDKYPILISFDGLIQDPLNRYELGK